MDLTAHYLPYLPVLVSAVIFFILAMVLFFRGERAMERSRKPLSWVRGYRKPGFPCREEVLKARSPGWLPLLLTALFALAAAVGTRLLAGQIADGDWFSQIQTPGALCLILLSAAGTVAAFCLLQQLFDSTFVSVCGSLLFGAAFLGQRAALCLLTISAWLLLKWLRADRARVSVELLYGAAVTVYGLALALVPQLLWLLPLIVILHWYKNVWLRRNNGQSGGRFFGTMALALLWWLLAAVLFVVVRCLVLTEGDFAAFLALPAVGGIPALAETALAGLPERLVIPVIRDRLLWPIMDAPLAALGLFGAISAFRMIRRRRNVRGVICLLVLFALAICWVLAGEYLLTLGLMLASGCLLNNCRLGGRRGFAVTYTVLGTLWYLGVYAAAWYLPLYEQIVQRLA